MEKEGSSHTVVNHKLPALNLLMIDWKIGVCVICERIRFSNRIRKDIFLSPFHRHMRSDTMLWSKILLNHPNLHSIETCISSKISWKYMLSSNVAHLKDHRIKGDFLHIKK